jgi:uncharacterized membrane protein
MTEIKQFLNETDEKSLIEAIKNAEKNTSGEIRVHIEKKAKKEVFERALEVFYLLKMNETDLRNGVLIYVATDDKKFAILGDEGIDEKVPDNFWSDEKELIASHFKKQEYVKGLELAIVEVGLKLKEFFPYQSDDTNELSDEISKG